MTLAFMGMALFEGNLLCLVGLMLVFLWALILEAILPSLMTRILPQHLRGSGSGLFAMCQFLGAALGGIGGGWLFQQWGSVAIFIMALILCVVWFFNCHYV